jgi:peroxiredoxin
MPTVGQPAPDFKLMSTEGREISLSDFKGKRKVVLAFYPLDFSPVCSVQIPDYDQHHDDFEKEDAIVLGISRDSVFAHKAWQEQLGLGSVPLLADMKGEAAAKYGVYLADKGISGRAIFVVDKAGILRHAHVEDKLSDRRTSEEVLEMVRKI